MMTINWTEVVIAVCGILLTGVIIPLIRAKRHEIDEKLNADQREAVEYWVDVAVRWAKQWLASESGETKKQEVWTYLIGKFDDLGIVMDPEDLDRLIEAVYETVKSESLHPIVE